MGDAEQIRPSARLRETAQAESGEHLADLVGDIEQIVRHRPRIALEDLGIGGQAGGTFDVAVLSHHAPDHHQRGGAELEAVGAE